MNQEPKVIMAESPEAASIQTVTGWVSSNGQFWGNDERMARYCGSTHKTCDCGAIVEQRSYCKYCHAKRSIEKYNKMERKAWDGDAMLYSGSHDKYFSDMDEVLDYCDDNEFQLHELRLVICEPLYASMLDIDSHCESELCEDDQAPKELREAAAVFNRAIEAYGKPLSWMPGKFALELNSVATEPAKS